MPGPYRDAALDKEISDGTFLLIMVSSALIFKVSRLLATIVLVCCDSFYSSCSCVFLVFLVFLALLVLLVFLVFLLHHLFLLLLSLLRVLVRLVLLVRFAVRDCLCGDVSKKPNVLPEIRGKKDE